MFRTIMVTLTTILLTNISYGKCPDRAKPYIPTIKKVTNQYWKDICPIETIPGQIQAESNWNIKAERKVGREYGFGLSQITIVKGYFNKFKEAKERWSKELKGWTWKDRFNPTYHIKFMVLYDKAIWNKITFAPTIWDRWGFTLSAYNGGLGGVLKDRRIAKVKGKCNYNEWFGCVEKYSWRSKSNFIINRRYVKNILTKFAPRYRDCFKP